MSVIVLSQISNLKFQIPHSARPTRKPPREVRPPTGFAPDLCIARAEKSQGPQVLNDAVPVREPEVEFEAGAHLVVQLEGDVLGEVADELRAGPPQLPLVPG